MKKIISGIIYIVLFIFIFLYFLKMTIYDYEEIIKYKSVCDMYMLGKDGEIHKRIYTNDEWEDGMKYIHGSDGKVYNLTKFDYHICKPVIGKN